jgi:hypothetical protein
VGKLADRWLYSIRYVREWLKVSISGWAWKLQNATGNGLTITAQHEVLPLITQLSVSTFATLIRPSGPTSATTFWSGKTSSPPSHNTEQRELKDAAFDRLILETFFYNLLKNNELMCYLVRSISVLSKRFCSIAWPNWGQVPCTDLHYKTNTETFAHWRTLYASQRETTRVQLLHEKSQRNTEYYWGGSS